ncbi:ParB N-terminal domain-containing protein [Bradyrhizobium sp. AUGA SZCCT0160]|uniref:ParB/RepB/Spo0J family partition protein n=1 Tax=Bradyrhizobium sp. AUGA SZCCT0160 TaxID=2807662 RepID=UPI001BACE93F|nr:ParB N-terminal domain-containing protein [Bradyrhizobium sp. AUGA SZCCT0160]MBR1187382.1 ParB N-terminal domain-containing protein [Bradyrhizobium sp. AUGA SZCCT0160]
MTAKNVEIAAVSGTESFIPLNKLKKSPRNARKTPHSEASIEAYAASIAAKGILQNLVVEPELDTEGAATGFYFVARFGVTPHVVRQRLRLGAVSPRLIQVYRDGDLALDQLMAFAIAEDHARQEAVYERLSYNRDASTIRRLLTETHVAASDRRAIFVGAEAYTEAGGTILRDLFTEDRGGYFEDVALLDLLVAGKLGRAADALREAEGWKWTQAHLDFPHAHGLRRTYPHPVELSVEDQAALDAAQAEFNSLTEQNETAEELPDEVDARFGELEAEIERLEAKRQAYDPDYIARGGAFVILNHDGTVRIERGFIRTEDEKPQGEAEHAGDASESADADSSEGRSGEEGEGEVDQSTDEEETDSPLSDILVRDLTAHRTLGLRLNLSEQPDVAVVAVTHALAAQIFYLGAEAQVVEIRPVNTVLASHADGIEDTPAGKAWADRHANWARQMPRDVTSLWTFVSDLDHDSRMVLLAHCVALTVNAVKLPWERKPRAQATADRLAEAVSLEMTGYWRPTVRTYFGRITKERILEAVREGVSHEAADRMADMKKPDMAEAAEQLLAATDWLPAMMRTPKTAQECVEQSQTDAAAEAPANAYADAAE